MLHLAIKYGIAYIWGMTIRYTAAATKALRRLPKKDARRLGARLAALDAGQPADVKAITGKPGLYRLRVGPYRAIFHRDGDAVVVAKIAKREDAYR